MTTVNQGRHCSMCSKTVTDFTIMTNEDIVKYLSVNLNVCGRLNDQQVINVNQLITNYDQRSNKGLKKWLMAAALLGSALLNKVNAQTPVSPQTVVQTANKDNASFTLGKISISAASIKTINGHVVDEVNSPLPGVAVKIPATNNGTVTDINGNFSINAPNDTKQLSLGCLGYKTNIVNVTDNIVNSYNMQPSERLFLGEVVVIRKSSFTKRIYSKCIKRPLHKIFN